MSRAADRRARGPSVASAERPLEIDLTRLEEGTDGSALDQVRARLADVLEQRADEVEEDVWAAVREQVPAYEALAHDPTTVEEVRASMGAMVRVFLDLVREARPFTLDELALMRTVGIRRAEQGLTSDDLYRAAHVALMVGLRHLRSDMKALGVSDVTFDAAGEIAEALHDYVNEVASAAGSGVREVQERRADECAEIVGQILDGALAGALAIREATAALGHPLGAPCTLLLVLPSRVDGPRSLAGPVSVLLRGHEGPLRGPVRSVPVPHAVAIAPHDGQGSVGELLRRAAEVASASDLVVVAERVVALSELSPTYQWICELLRVPVTHRPPGITEIDDLVPHWLVSGLPAGADFLFARRIVGPLLTSDRATQDRILRTVRAYFAAEGSIKDTSAVLGINRRTVERHLTEFERLTGRSLRQPTQQVLVQHALRLLELRNSAFPSPGEAAWNREAPS